MIHKLDKMLSGNIFDFSICNRKITFRGNWHPDQIVFALAKKENSTLHIGCTNIEFVTCDLCIRIDKLKLFR